MTTEQRLAEIAARAEKATQAPQSNSEMIDSGTMSLLQDIPWLLELVRHYREEFQKIGCSSQMRHAINVAAEALAYEPK